MLSRRSLAFVVGILCISAANSTKAESISVTNADFSTLGAPLSQTCLGIGCAYNTGPIPGWAISGSAGSWDPSAVYLTSLPPGETTVAYVNGGSISQDLGVPLVADTTYTLSVYVGDRLDGYTTNYEIGLAAGSTVLNSFSSSNASITPGTFALETVSFTTGSVTPSGDLTIFLTDLGPQADFGNVSVTTPEPKSILLLGLALSILLVVGSTKKSNLAVRSAK